MEIQKTDHWLCSKLRLCFLLTTESGGHSGGANNRSNSPLYQKDSAKVVQTSDKDASGTLPWKAVLEMSGQEEADPGPAG